MEYLELTCQLNTRANQLLLSGDAASAFGHYRAAIKLLNDCQVAHLAIESDHIILTESSGRYTVAGQVAVARRCISKQDAAPSDDCFWSPLYEFSLDDKGCKLNVNLLAFYSAIVIYNCAVCLHQRRGWMVLQKASNLYAQCAELLQPLTFQLDCNEVLASVLQNQANIYYNLNDFHSVRSLLDKVFLLQQQDCIKQEANANTIAPEA
jgi:tetratricopeptide (TPR) repeat protein